MEALQILATVVMFLILMLGIYAIIRVGARADGVDRHECGDSGWQPKETRG